MLINVGVRGDVAARAQGGVRLPALRLAPAGGAARGRGGRAAAGAPAAPGRRPAPAPGPRRAPAPGPRPAPGGHVARRPRRRRARPVRPLPTDVRGGRRGRCGTLRSLSTDRRGERDPPLALVCEVGRASGGEWEVVVDRRVRRASGGGCGKLRVLLTDG